MKDVLLIIGLFILIFCLVLGCYGLGGLVWWGVGNFFIWAFNINFVWTYWHGLAMALVSSLIGGITIKVKSED